MSDAFDEHDFIRRARAGDRDALAGLLEHHQPRIYRFTMKLCRHPEDAKGVLQETMLDAVRGISSFRGEASLSSWLYTLARSRCIKRRRKLAPKSLEPIHEQDHLPHDSAGPDEDLVGRELASAIERALGELDDGEREVLVLRDVEGLSGKEAAEILGISVAAMKSRLFRARETLRAKLRHLVHEDEAPRSGCPDIVRAFSEKLEGDLDALDCKKMEEHLEGCPRCQHVCDSVKQTLSACQALPEPQLSEDTKREVRAAIRVAIGSMG